MLINTKKSVVTVGSELIGSIKLVSNLYITNEETEYKEQLLKALDPIREKIKTYCEIAVSKINAKLNSLTEEERKKYNFSSVKLGDVMDCFYYNTTNAIDIKSFLIEFDENEFSETLKETQKLNDVISSMNAFTMLKFRVDDPIVKTEIDKLKPQDMLTPGKVCTKALFLELLVFYESEMNSIPYTYESERIKERSETNFI
jgi:hypothetical protein